MGLISEFNKALSLWFNKHGITNLDFVEGEDFCYYPEYHTVQWGMLGNPKIDHHFTQFLYEYGLEHNDIPVFYLSLLHEVGHFMTLDCLDSIEVDSAVRAKNNRISDGTIETDYWYWELDIEFLANMWAINFMNHHKNWVDELCELCAPHLDGIFSDANILSQLGDWIQDVEDGNYVPLCIDEE